MCFVFVLHAHPFFVAAEIQYVGLHLVVTSVASRKQGSKRHGIALIISILSWKWVSP